MIFGPFRLDGATESVWRDTQEIRLRPKTFAILRYLVEHPRRLVTKEELLDAVWSDVAVGEAALAVCVAEARRALGDDARTPRYIETVHRRGYRFIGSVPAVAVPLGAGGEVSSPDTPLIGRETELVGLRAALDDAWSRRGRLVAVHGEAGIGKSRIVEELGAEAVARGGRVMLGRCYETEQILPFGPWVNAMRHGGALRELDDAGAVADAWRAALARLFPELGAAPPPADYAQDLRLFEGMAYVVEHVARRQPLVLVLEDLHWADEMSIRLVGFLARHIRAWSVLMVVTVREEELPASPLLHGLLEELMRDDRAVRMTLSPLSRTETAALVRALAPTCGDEPALARLAERLWTVSEGNPFLVVETMRVAQDGAAPETASGVPLPERVRDIITARLARLSASAQLLAAVASVIGRDFDFAVLARAAGLDELRVAEGVEELVRRRVLRATAERLDFTHDRIREVAYGQLLPPRRRLLHAQVAAAMEAVYHDALEPHYAALAAHCCRGEIWDKGLVYLRHAGQGAVGCSANRDAIAYFDQALQVLEHLPDGRSKTEQAYDLRMSRGAAYYSLGELRRIVDQLDEAEALARTLEDQTRLGRVAVLRLGCLAAMGDQTAAIETGKRGLALAEAAGSRPRQAVATVMLGFAELGRGDLPQAITLLRKSGELLEGHPVHERFGQIGLPAVFWRTWLIFSLAELGEFHEAMPIAEESVRIAEAADQPFSVAEAQGALGHLACVKGEPLLGIPALERSVTLCREYKLAVLSPVMVGSLGHAYALAGRLSDAVPTLEEAVALGVSMGAMWWQARRLAELGEAYLLAGRVDDAMVMAEDALAVADAHGERANRAYVLRLLGEVASRRTPPDFEAADRQLSQALAVAEDLGLRPLAAHCRRGLGTLDRRTRTER